MDMISSGLKGLGTVASIASDFGVPYAGIVSKVCDGGQKLLGLVGGGGGGIMANMVLCVIPGQGNSKILNLVKSGSFDSPIFLYIPNDEKTSTGHLI